MLLVTNHRKKFGVLQPRELEPGTTAAETFLHGQATGRCETESPHESNMDARQLVIAEALLNDTFIQNVEWTQREQTGGVGDKTAPLKRCRVLDFDFALQLRREHCSRRERRFLKLLVKPSRKQKELAVLEGKAIPPLGDTSFAKDDALFATANRLADDGPFLECHTQGVWLDWS